MVNGRAQPEAAETSGRAADQSQDHSVVLSYLKSSEWEARLADARIKREAVFEARRRAAQQAKDPVTQTVVVGETKSGEASNTVLPVASDIALMTAVADVPATVSMSDRPMRRRAFAGVAGLALVSGALVIWSQHEISKRTSAPIEVTRATDSGSPFGGNQIDISRVTGQSTVDIPAVLAGIPSNYSVTIVTADPEIELGGTATQRILVTPFAFAKPTVTFYAAQDAQQAEDLAMQLNGETLDMTGLRAGPPAGVLAVHLIGS